MTRQCDVFFRIKSMLQPEKAEKESSQQHTARPCMSLVLVDKDKLSREEMWKNISERKLVYNIDQWIFPVTNKKLTETAANANVLACQRGEIEKKWKKKAETQSTSRNQAIVVQFSTTLMM
ncbi:hypothetical protein T4E_11354 [Trichinella pseudospiralis]|uniref:Uncharacterized protein n=1 Tax=Trichinella pseudospiralis TaxID=6337 RepID=A0A0V0YMP4_TRIPS|nr:hypothetical protein T4E_11354 [Trichinella pseudospiralis]